MAHHMGNFPAHIDFADAIAVRLIIAIVVVIRIRFCGCLSHKQQTGNDCGEAAEFESELH